MHTFCLQFFVISLLFLSVFAKNDRFVKRKLKYIPRTAHQLREFHKNHPRPFSLKQWSGQQKYYMPNYPGDVLLDAISVGTPGVSYFINSELGVRKMWIIDINYKHVSSDVQKYNSSASSTSVPTGKSVEGYTGLARLEGYNYLDRVEIYQNWTQTIAVITKTYDELNNPIFFNRVDGVVGYAWDPNEDRKNVTAASSPILNMLKPYTQKRYSFWLEKTSDGQSAMSVKVIGSFNTESCKDDYIFVPLSYFDNYSPLSFTVSGFKINDYKTSKSGTGKVDTGLAVLFMPLEQYLAVYNMLKPDFDDDLQILTTSCSNRGKFPKMIFTIGGRDFALSSNYYVVKIFDLDDGRCAFAIEASIETDIPWALGTPFLRKYCSHFDVENNQIGFSTALFQPDN